MTALHLRTVLAPHGPAGAIELTDAQVAELGGGKRAAVRVAVNGQDAIPLRLMVMGGCNLVGFRRSAREGLGIAIGEEIDAVITLDTVERVVEVPDDLAAALDADPAVRAAFDAMPYTHRKEYVTWVTEAKRPETRERRITGTVDGVKAGKTR